MRAFRCRAQSGRTRRRGTCLRRASGLSSAATWVRACPPARRARAVRPRRRRLLAHSGWPVRPLHCRAADGLALRRTARPRGYLHAGRGPSSEPLGHRGGGRLFRGPAGSCANWFNRKGSSRNEVGSLHGHAGNRTDRRRGLPGWRHRIIPHRLRRRHASRRRRTARSRNRRSATRCGWARRSSASRDLCQRLRRQPASMQQLPSLGRPPCRCVADVGRSSKASTWSGTSFIRRCIPWPTTPRNISGADLRPLQVRR